MGNQEIGTRIKQLREAQNRSRSAFASQVGISAKHLYEIEMGKRNFSVPILARFAQVLSVSCDYIVFGEDTNAAGNMYATGVAGMSAKQWERMRYILGLLYEMCDVR